MRCSLSCFCPRQDLLSAVWVLLTPKPPGCQEQQKCPQSQTPEEFRAFRVIHPRAGSILSSEQALLVSCLSCVYQWVVKGQPGSHRLCPLCLPDPQHPLSEAQQLIWVGLHPHWGAQGLSAKLKPLLDEPLARGRRGTGLCQESQLGASPQLPAKISPVTSILWLLLLLLWCTKSNKSPARS